MNVAIVIEYFNPHAGGLERSTAQIARELAARGHNVTLLAGACKDTTCLSDSAVSIRALSRRKSSTALRLLSFTRWARQQIAEGDFDTTLSMTTAVPARVLQPRGGTVRETLERNIAMRPSATARLTKRLAVALNPKQRLLLHLENKALSDPHLYMVAAVSSYVTRQLAEHYNFPPEKTQLIPNAAVVKQVDQQQRNTWRKRIRAGFNIPDDTTAFLFAAINPRLKGFSPLIKALALLKERGVPAVVLLAGDFWYAHNREAHAAGVRDRVRFVRHTRQIEPLYAAADVTVHPTFYDPASKVVIESLMLGVPAISTACNGASDLIEPYDSPQRGRVIPDPADASALADAMQQLTDPATRRACQNACANLAPDLDMSAHVTQLETLLHESCSHTTTPAP